MARRFDDHPSFLKFLLHHAWTVLHRAAASRRRP